MTEHLDVVIVGAGISGVSAAWHLQDRCPNKSYAILEKRENMGGTWDLFRYPGIRSDSDMYTLGFRFRPWTERQSIADGKPILDYVKSTAAMYGIDKHIRFNHNVVGADWSSAENRWTLHIETSDAKKAISCSFLFLCSGYYNYEQGYSPKFPGVEDFTGPIIHPQHWPEDLDYTDKKVVVIGSGSTSVTLVPALADSGAKHVTMLQRSPTYIISQPDQDPIAATIRRWLPEDKAYTIIRWKNVVVQVALYQACRRWPQRLRKILMGLVKRQLPNGYDLEKHFGPQYNPWDQRLCVVPNGDLFRTIRDGKTEVVTDTIERFTETGIKLASGRQLPADVIVTATGLDLRLFGGATVSVDGGPVDLTQTMDYKGMMLSGLPNMAYTVGYTNIGWTLKADLVSEFVCRLLNYMDDNGFDTVVAERPGPDVDERPFMEFTPGYVLRKLDELPKQGSRTPWRLSQNYLLDVRLIRRGKVADEGLRFAKSPPHWRLNPRVDGLDALDHIGGLQARRVGDWITGSSARATESRVQWSGSSVRISPAAYLVTVRHQGHERLSLPIRMHRAGSLAVRLNRPGDHAGSNCRSHRRGTLSTASEF